jgi:hypothetical protein
VSIFENQILYKVKKKCFNSLHTLCRFLLIINMQPKITTSHFILFDLHPTFWSFYFCII